MIKHTITLIISGLLLTACNTNKSYTKNGITYPIVIDGVQYSEDYINKLRKDKLKSKGINLQACPINYR